MASDTAATLKAIAQIGYNEVEFAGYHGHSPQEIKALLNNNGLSAPSAHLSLDVFENNFDAALEAAHMLGHKYLVLAYLQEKDRTVERYKTIFSMLNAAGEKARAAGIHVAYHNHEFEFETVDNVVPYDILLAETDPELVKLQLDLYWLAVAKQDPMELIDRAPGRVHLVHIKDRSANGKMADVGTGQIDFKRVFKASKKAGLQHYFIERDDAANPLASAATSFKNLRALRF